MVDSSTVELRLLGTMDAVVDGVGVSLGGPRRRRLLLALALARGQVVSDEALAEVVWPEADDRPGDPINTVHQYVSRLRGLLGAAAIETATPGYRLAGTVSLDIDRFEAAFGEARALASRGDWSGARVAVSEALELWRGPSFGDLGDTEIAMPHVGNLTEVHTAAEELAVDLLMEEGLAVEAAAAAERLVGLHPLRESPVRTLARARHATGSTAEAVRALHEYRERLAEETGLEPTADLVTLEQQLLQNDVPPAPAATRQLRGYDLVEQIGEGAFGSIYRATQPAVGREVAVKVVRADLADDPQFIRRFEIEAQTVARLEHPHIVPLFDFWREPGGAYLVMRYLRGGSAEQRLVLDGPLPLADVARLVDEIGGALAVAHSHGIVHRDVKPANILFDENGNSYLADFGIAVAVESSASIELRSAGSPIYVSPEQVRDGEPSELSDVYALGVVLFELLTGDAPFGDASSMQELFERKLVEALPRVSELRPEVPSAVDDVLRKATAPTPADRFPDVGEMVLAFRVAVAAGDGVASETAPEISGRPRAAASETLVSIELQNINPYKGLAAFEEGDAADFFGRAALIGELDERVAASRFLAVVGPSGSGKSSVVRAGLMPRLRDDDTYVVQIVPGQHPMHEVETALLQIASEPIPTLLEQLTADELGLKRAVERSLPTESGQLVLLIDQFEELFTLTSSEDRDSFLAALAAAVQDPRSRLKVITTVRADFYDRPLGHPAVSDLVRANTIAVTPLNAEELERAITGPAARVGVGVEPALVAELVAQATASPGMLPLLQFALTETFERRSGGQLTLAAYEELGGVGGAVAQRADDVFASLRAAESQTVRRLFTRLVAPGEGTEDTRRRARVAEMSNVDPAVVEAFGRARLLSFDRDPVTREPTVEVAHEALIREWPRLRSWLDEDRDALRVGRHLSTAASAWDAVGRDAGELYRGGRLEVAEEYAEAHPGDLNDVEREFLSASVTRRAEELAREARSRRRLRGLLAGVAVVAILALIAGAVAFQQRGRADREAEIALVRAEEATESAEQARASEEVADAARIDAQAAQEAGDTRRLISDAAALADDRQDLALLLASEAYRRQPDASSVAGLQEILSSLDSFLGVVASGDSVLNAHHLADGNLVVLTATDVVFYDRESLLELARVPIPGDRKPFGVEDQFIRSTTVVGSSLYAGFDDGSIFEFTRIGATQVADVGHVVSVVNVDEAEQFLDVGDIRGVVTRIRLDDGDVLWSHDLIVNESLLEVLSPEAAAFYQFAVVLDGVFFRSGPQSILDQPDGSLLVAAGHRLLRLDGATGAPLAEFLPTTPWLIGPPETPARASLLTSGPDGLVYALSTFALWVFTPELELVNRFEIPLGQRTRWVVPVGLAVGEAGGVAIVLNTAEVIVAPSPAEIPEAERTALPLVTARSAQLADGGGSLIAAGEGGAVLWSVDGSGLLFDAVVRGEANELSALRDGTFVTILDRFNRNARRLYDIRGSTPALVPPLEAESDYHRLSATSDVFFAYRRDAAFGNGLTFMARETYEPIGTIDNVGGSGYTSPDFEMVAFPGLNEPTFRVYGTFTAEPLSPTIDLSEWGPGIGVRAIGFDLRRNLATGVLSNGVAVSVEMETWTVQRVWAVEETGGIFGIAYARDADIMVTRSQDGLVSVRDPETFDVVSRYAGGSAITDRLGVGLALSNDGQYLMSTSGHFPRLWDLDSGVLLGEFPHESGLVANVYVDGGLMRLGTINGEYGRLWRIDVAGWPEIACRAAGRNMTLEEWEQFGPSGEPYRATCAQWPAAG